MHHCSDARDSTDSRLRVFPVETHERSSRPPQTHPRAPLTRGRATLGPRRPPPSWTPWATPWNAGRGNLGCRALPCKPEQKQRGICLPPAVRWRQHSTGPRLQTGLPSRQHGASAAATSPARKPVRTPSGPNRPALDLTDEVPPGDNLSSGTCSHNPGLYFTSEYRSATWLGYMRWNAPRDVARFGVNRTAMEEISASHSGVDLDQCVNRQASFWE